MTVSPFLNIASVTNSPVLIIIPSCELVRGTSDQFVEALLPRVQREATALDLSKVERIDAAGIAALITLYCSAVEAGHEFYVVDPSVRVLELLRLVGLESILLPQSGIRGESTPVNGTDHHEQARLTRSAA